MPINFKSIRLVTFEEENLEKERYWALRPLKHSSPEEAQRQADYWATKTMQERVTAGWDLADREDAEYKLKLEEQAASGQAESDR